MEPNAPGFEQPPAPVHEELHDTAVDPIIAQSEEVPQTTPHAVPILRTAEAVVQGHAAQEPLAVHELPPHRQETVLKLEQVIGMQAHTPAQAQLLSTTLRDLRAA